DQPVSTFSKTSPDMPGYLAAWAHMVAVGVEKHDLSLESAAGLAAPLAPGAGGCRRTGQAGAGDSPAPGADAPAPHCRRGVVSILPAAGTGGSPLYCECGFPLLGLRRHIGGGGLPDCPRGPPHRPVRQRGAAPGDGDGPERPALGVYPGGPGLSRLGCRIDRKSTRLNSSHVSISYAVFCLQKKTTA